MRSKSEQNITKGGLDALILAIVNEHPTHGYAIITGIRDRHGVYLGPSTVYPALGKLMKRKLLTAEWGMLSERPRKTYTITREGVSELRSLSVQISVLFKEVTKTINTAVQ